MTSNIPTIDFSKPELKPGTAQWDSTKIQVLQAFQEYGCFIATYDKVPNEIREAMFDSSREILEFPLETKLKNVSDKPFHGYAGQIPHLPFYESLCIADLLQHESVETFANIFRPDGNPDFCNVVKSYSKPLVELDEMVKRMVLESLGIKHHIDEFLDPNFFRLRLTRYEILQDEDGNIKPDLSDHTDGGFLTIISQNEVNGLQIFKKNGDEWIDVNIAPNSFCVISGDSFMAWTNGRLHSPVHRIKMTGDNDRFSIQLFSSTKSSYTIKAPKELVDEYHPLLFKPFNSSMLGEYYTCEAWAKAGSDKAFKVFCGI